MEDDDSGNGFKKPASPSIYDSLKKTSTVTANNVDRETGEIKSDPTEGISIGKIKGVSGTSKVRELLAGLNPEKD
jgi:hypothetical protein